MVKKIMLFFVVCLWVTTTVFANGESQSTTVQVTGTSQKEVAPDIAKMSLSITTMNASLEQAKNTNAQTANQVFEKLNEQGITKQQIKTDSYNIDSIYSYENNRLPKLKGYKVTNTIEISTSIENIGIVVNEVTLAGANEINSIRFEKMNETDMKNEALTEAVQDALQKAEVIASALNKKVSRVKVVNDSGTSYYPVTVDSRLYKTVSAEAVSPTIVAGKVSVGATVQVTVELE